MYFESHQVSWHEDLFNKIVFPRCLYSKILSWVPPGLTRWDIRVTKFCAPKIVIQALMFQSSWSRVNGTVIWPVSARKKRPGLLVKPDSSPRTQICRHGLGWEPGRKKRLGLPVKPDSSPRSQICRHGLGWVPTGSVNPELESGTPKIPISAYVLVAKKASMTPQYMTGDGCRWHDPLPRTVSKVTVPTRPWSAMSDSLGWGRRGGSTSTTRRCGRLHVDSNTFSQGVSALASSGRWTARERRMFAEGFGHIHATGWAAAWGAAYIQLLFKIQELFKKIRTN
jgi:hypothetical protein